MPSPLTVSPVIPQLATTYRGAGQALGVSERTVWQLVRDGHLRACRIGRAVRIPLTELQRYLEEQTAQAANRTDDYVDRAGLLALGLEEAVCDRLLLATPLSGNDGRPVVEAGSLPDLLAMLSAEGRADQ